MGVDIWFRTRNMNITYDYRNQQDVDYFLSRFFCYFLTDYYNDYDNSEFGQVQKILNLDLSPLLLTNYVDTGDRSGTEAYLESLTKQLYQTKNISKQLTIEEEIEKTEQELLKEQEQWNDINEIEKLILSFKENLLKNPDLPQKLQFRFLSTSYFSINPENDENLMADLNKIVQFIAFAKSKGEQKFAFYFM